MESNDFSVRGEHKNNRHAYICVEYMYTLNIYVYIRSPYLHHHD